VKKFSHGLREFRNYIHPYEQMVSGFAPDEHTAKVCFQVLKAALASLAGERKLRSLDESDKHQGSSRMPEGGAKPSYYAMKIH
jgi:hypothetical protein